MRQRFSLRTAVCEKQRAARRCSRSQSTGSDDSWKLVVGQTRRDSRTPDVLWNPRHSEPLCLMRRTAPERNRKLQRPSDNVEQENCVMHALGTTKGKPNCKMNCNPTTHGRSTRNRVDCCEPRRIRRSRPPANGEGEGQQTRDLGNRRMKDNLTTCGSW
jgi:hypothetical protein